MKTLVLCLFMVFGMTFVSSAQKYGYIDSEFILGKMPEYKEAKDRLDKLAERWTKEIEERYEMIKKKKIRGQIFISTSFKCFLLEL